MKCTKNKPSIEWRLLLGCATIIAGTAHPAMATACRQMLSGSPIT